MGKFRIGSSRNGLLAAGFRQWRSVAPQSEELWLNSGLELAVEGQVASRTTVDCSAFRGSVFTLVEDVCAKVEAAHRTATVDRPLMNDPL